MGKKTPTEILRDQLSNLEKQRENTVKLLDTVEGAIQGTQMAIEAIEKEEAREEKENV